MEVYFWPSIFQIYQFERQANRGMALGVIRKFGECLILVDCGANSSNINPRSWNNCSIEILHESLDYEPTKVKDGPAKIILLAFLRKCENVIKHSVLEEYRGGGQGSGWRRKGLQRLNDALRSAGNTENNVKDYYVKTNRGESLEIVKPLNPFAPNREERRKLAEKIRHKPWAVNWLNIVERWQSGEGWSYVQKSRMQDGNALRQSMSEVCDEKIVEYPEFSDQFEIARKSGGFLSVIGHPGSGKTCLTLERAFSGSGEHVYYLNVEIIKGERWSSAIKFFDTQTSEPATEKFIFVIDNCQENREKVDKDFAGYFLDRIVQSKHLVVLIEHLDQGGERYQWKNDLLDQELLKRSVELNAQEIARQIIDVKYPEWSRALAYKSLGDWDNLFLLTEYLDATRLVDSNIDLSVRVLKRYEIPAQFDKNVLLQIVLIAGQGIPISRKYLSRLDPDEFTNQSPIVKIINRLCDTSYSPHRFIFTHRALAKLLVLCIATGASKNEIEECRLESINKYFDWIIENEDEDHVTIANSIIRNSFRWIPSEETAGHTVDRVMDAVMRFGLRKLDLPTFVLTNEYSIDSKVFDATILVISDVSRNVDKRTELAKEITSTIGSIGVCVPQKQFDPERHHVFIDAIDDFTKIIGVHLIFNDAPVSEFVRSCDKERLLVFAKANAGMFEEFLRWRRKSIFDWAPWFSEYSKRIGWDEIYKLLSCSRRIRGRNRWGLNTDNCVGYRAAGYSEAIAEKLWPHFNETERVNYVLASVGLKNAWYWKEDVITTVAEDLGGVESLLGLAWQGAGMLGLSNIVQSISEPQRTRVFDIIENRGFQPVAPDALKILKFVMTNWPLDQEYVNNFNSAVQYICESLSPLTVEKRRELVRLTSGLKLDETAFGMFCKFCEMPSDIKQELRTKLSADDQLIQTAIEGLDLINLGKFSYAKISTVCKKYRIDTSELVRSEFIAQMVEKCTGNDLRILQIDDNKLWKGAVAETWKQKVERSDWFHLQQLWKDSVLTGVFNAGVTEVVAKQLIEKAADRELTLFERLRWWLWIATTGDNEFIERYLRDNRSSDQVDGATDFQPLPTYGLNRSLGQGCIMQILFELHSALELCQVTPLRRDIAEKIDHGFVMLSKYVDDSGWPSIFINICLFRARFLKASGGNLVRGLAIPINNPGAELLGLLQLADSPKTLTTGEYEGLLEDLDGPVESMCSMVEYYDARSGSVHPFVTEMILVANAHSLVRDSDRKSVRSSKMDFFKYLDEEYKEQAAAHPWFEIVFAEFLGD